MILWHFWIQRTKSLLIKLYKVVNNNITTRQPTRSKLKMEEHGYTTNDNNFIVKTYF